MAIDHGRRRRPAALVAMLYTLAFCGLLDSLRQYTAFVQPNGSYGRRGTLLLVSSLLAGQHMDPAVADIQAIEPPRVVGKDAATDPNCLHTKGYDDRKEWASRAEYKTGSDTLVFDFSPIGGPKKVEGKFIPREMGGISFPDGTVWKRISRPDYMADVKRIPKN